MLDLVRNALNRTESNSHQDKIKVLLNVYDMLQPSLIRKLGHILGIGIYHSGIEIGGHEYCFGGHDYEKVTGVFIVQPKSGLQGLLFKQSINMGCTSLTQQQVSKLLKDISKEYMGTSYKLLTRNCNHFSEDLCKRLTGKTAPGWINRAAKLGTMFPCVIPTEWIEPPDANENVMTDTTGSTSLSSNTPLKNQSTKAAHSSTKTVVNNYDENLIIKVPEKNQSKRYSSPSSRRPSGSADSIHLVRTPIIEDDEIDYSSPVKEPDTYRPEVIRSATQLSITAPIIVE